YALSVNEIKGLLDSCEIAYQEAGLFSETDELFVQSEAEEEVKKEVDTNLLDNYIVNFNMLEQSDYTPESYAVLGTALEKAREIKGDKNATQEEIDDAVTQLEIARSGLVLASKINWPFLILILVLIVAILAALILYILYLRGVIGHRGERESLQTLQGMMEASRETLSGNLAAAQHVRPEAVRRPERAPDRGNGTTVLQTSYNQGEGTTVLGVSNRLGMSAYLTRRKTSEKIAVNGTEFVIGKDPGMTNYCISDNSTISRTHAKILCSGAVYYVVDLNSTNSTYLDGRLLHSGEKTELRSGSILRLSDEEFVFNEA
ncbi:MAG: FHA domain-containing protein, partial [Lachnospiraceae bacterium]|nr:FHA domain-containing protein [Lachnospiraceae bacterium]